MKKLLTILAAVMTLTACNESKQQESVGCVDAESAVTEVMMSRRSIRNYKDSLISRETLDEI